ncbi:MAG: TetR/AcrR family transcriptional regulator [Sandaracinaceae bacterium]
MTDTKTRIMDSAERLTQERGFNGFSYIDLASETGIKTSSVHYHFKLKADLALALVVRIHETHLDGFAALNTSERTPTDRLRSVVMLFESYATEDKFCLCGMMSAELHSVSAPVRSRLIAYFDDLQAWLRSQFEEMGNADPALRALEFVSCLEGALLLARLRGDPALVGRTMESFTRR